MDDHMNRTRARVCCLAVEAAEYASEASCASDGEDVWYFATMAACKAADAQLASDEWGGEDDEEIVEAVKAAWASAEAAQNASEACASLERRIRRIRRVRVGEQYGGEPALYRCNADFDDQREVVELVHAVGGVPYLAQLFSGDREKVAKFFLQFRRDVGVRECTKVIETLIR